MWVTLPCGLHYYSSLKTSYPDLRLGINMVFPEICGERSQVLLSKQDCGLHCVTGCDIMGYIHKLNRIEMRLAIAILQKKFMKIQYVMHQKM